MLCLVDLRHLTGLRARVVNLGELPVVEGFGILCVRSGSLMVMNVEKDAGGVYAGVVSSRSPWVLIAVCLMGLLHVLRDLIRLDIALLIPKAGKKNARGRIWGA